MATHPLFRESKSSSATKFWIPGLFVLTLATLWVTGALGRSFVSTYLPHGFCFLWNRTLLWTHLISDVVIALSYLAISTTLIVLVLKARGEIPFSWMFLAFGAFIVACGATHLMEVITLWKPIYWLSANVKVVTAIASLSTAVALPALMPSILGVLHSARLSEGRRMELEAAQAVLQGEVETRGQTLEKLAYDIAARNRELEDSRLRLLITLRSIGDAVIATNAEGNITFMNGVAEQLTGWNLHEAEGLQLTEVFHIVNEETHAPVENPVTKVRRSLQVVGLANHTLLIRRDGQEIHIDDSGSPILDTDGKLTGIILIFRDISEKRRAEEARMLLASIVDSSEDAIVSRDLKGAITSWNRGATNLYGYSAHEVIGKQMELGPDQEDGSGPANGTAVMGQRLQHMESRRTTKDGRAIDVSLTISPVYNAAGELVGTATIGRDVTLQKQTEEALRTSEKLAATGRLAAAISHEINNPLEAVMNLIYLIDAESQSFPELNAYAAKAQEELRRVAHITRQTLAFYRETSKPHEVDLHEVASGILDIYQREIQGRSLTAHLNLAPGSKVEGFPGELRQVFSNLIRNAIEAVPDGGELWIEGSQDGDGFLCVSVVDSGPGIPQESQRRIFDPFYTTKGANGTGLGLWVSLGIVQKHGGRLAVVSPVPGQARGAQFTVRIPTRFQNHNQA